MARISTYARDLEVIGSDRWIGTSWDTADKLTKNFTADAVASYFNKSAIIDTGQFSWGFLPYNNTQAQPEKTFMKVDWLNDTININNLSGVLRVSALTLGNTQPGAFIENEWVGNNILVHIPNAPSAYSIYTVDALVPDGDWYYLMSLSFVGGESFIIQKNEPVVMGYFAGANVITEITGTFPILVSEGAIPNISIDPTIKGEWDLAYNNSIVSAAVTGTTTKTLTLTQQDGGTITASWTDIDTNIITSVFGRTGAIIAQAGDYTTTLVTEGTNLYFTDQRARNVISSSITGITYNNTNGIFSLTSGYIVPTTTEETNWNTAYNNSIVSASVTGVATKTLTLTQQDGGTLTASWTDENTDAVTSVFGRAGAVVAQSGDYNTDQVSEGTTNLYFTNARSRSAISLTTTGTTGASTYNPSTGVLNIPTYAAGVTSFNTRTGAITLSSADVTGALGYTPEDVANKSNNTLLGTSDVLYPTQNAVKTYIDSATAGGIILQGDWNAATNTPDITGTTHAGFAWRVSVAGNTNLGGITDWNVGDLAVKSATGWIKIDNTESVTSVFGRFGTVVAQSGDYNTDQVTEGSTNLYFTQARAIASPITGYNPVAGTITATDSILTAINKLSGNISGGYVPYTGATSNVNLGEKGITAGYVGFDLTPTAIPTSVGTMYWDSTYRTVSLIDGDGDTTLQIGQEERILVHNNTGSALTDGQVVYVTGSTGNLPSVSLADASSETTSAATLGVVTEVIANGADGFITVSGIVNQLNTLAFAEGDLLWLSETAGQFTNVKPIAPAHLVLIGYVIKRAGGNGSILVKIQNTQELSESSDVLISAPKIDGQGLFLQTIGSVQLWRNRSIVDVLGYTPANQATTITINGTTQDLSANRTWSVGTVTSVGLTLGTSGTDANISNSPITSSGSITLNLPTASAANRGLLSNGDWSTFNNKQNTITLTTTGSSGAATLIGTTLNIPNYGSALSGYLPLTGGTLTGGLYINPQNTATVGLDVASDTIRFRSDNLEGTKRQLTTTLGSGTLVKMQAAGYGGTYVTDLGFYTSSNSAVNTTPNLYLTGGNNYVGINTDSPIYQLDIFGTTRVNGQLILTSTIASPAYTYTLPGATGTLALTSQIPSVTGFVPYTGATSAVNLGAYDLTVNGIKVGRGAGAVGDNTALGNIALNANTTGSANTAIGYAASNANTTAGSNTAVGYFALAGTTTGGSNTAIGSGALTSNLTGTFNTGIGKDALSANTTGQDNVAVGQFANGSNTTASRNSSFGNQSLFYNTTGYSNVAIGYQSLLGNTTGRNNTAIGVGSGQYITTGILNTIVGSYGGTTTMSNNVILSDGSGNIRFQYDGTNTILGQSGAVQITGALSGTSATFVASGTYTNFLIGTTSTTGAILSDANRTNLVLGAGTSNKIIFNNASTTQNGYIYSDASELSLGYPASGTFNIQKVGVGSVFTITSSGSVGIGTNSPGRKLQINVTPVLGEDDGINVYNGSSNFLFTRTASTYTYRGVAPLSGMIYCENNITLLSDGGNITFNNSGSERMRITNDGVALFGASTLPSSSVSGVAIQNPRTLGPTIFSSGNVSDSRTFIQFINANGVVGTIQTSGSLTLYNTTSDYRLKEDLKPINGLEIVNKIKVYDYKWKVSNDRMDGVLAHELAEVLPYAVSGIKDGAEMQSVDYSKIVPVMVQAIKDLKTELDKISGKV